MPINRREFALALGAGTLQSRAFAAAPPSGGGLVAQAADAGRADAATAARPHYFFRHPTFEYVFLVALGRAYHGAGNVGKVLWLTRQVADGDFDSAFDAFIAAGDEARAIADESLAGGHRESARHAYLWAQNYYDSATYFVDGSSDPTRFLPTWERLHDGWMKAIALFERPPEPVFIPYEGTVLHGFHFRAAGPARKRPLLILVNGSDGSLLDLWTWGAAAALARGYDCLAFDGPGQGYALWKQGLHFRPDWEHVITPVVDFMLQRRDIDPRRIAIQGISQGGYWVPRAVAFEHRIAAAIADPGVVDVSTSWTGALPPPIVELLHAGRKAAFDGFLEKSLTPALRANLRFRMRPYGFDSYFDTFQATTQYRVTDVADRIRCPMLITAPVNESFWPGQSQRLYDLLQSPKRLEVFSESDGADLHCEPKGTGIRDLRVFDWLDATLGR